VPNISEACSLCLLKSLERVSQPFYFYANYSLHLHLTIRAAQHDAHTLAAQCEAVVAEEHAAAAANARAHADHTAAQQQQQQQQQQEHDEQQRLQMQLEHDRDLHAALDAQRAQFADESERRRVDAECALIAARTRGDEAALQLKQCQEQLQALERQLQTRQSEQQALYDAQLKTQLEKQTQQQQHAQNQSVVLAQQQRACAEWEQAAGAAKAECAALRRERDEASKQRADSERQCALWTERVRQLETQCDALQVRALCTWW
jgi:hypothetical protein